MTDVQQSDLTASDLTAPSPHELPPKAEFIQANLKDWLKDFYKECGREATLAYTTLNQMKNWAITVQGAIIASIVAFSKANAVPPYDGASISLAFPIAVGSVLAYVFTLRFFVRALLCYNNLQRWNTLQSKTLEAMLLPRDSVAGSGPLNEAERLAALRQSIQDYYYRWRSPIGRTKQLASNLKLGFGILVAMPIVLLGWSSALVIDSPVVQGLLLFAVGATFIEAEDFLTSPFFDTPDRATRAQRTIFPAVGSDVSYILRWAGLTALVGIVVLRPWITVALFGPGALPPPPTAF
jgi:hypothetical protein